MTRSTVFRYLDIFSDYWRTSLAEKAPEESAVCCNFESFQFELLRFILMNTLLACQRTAETIFKHLNFVCIYIDDSFISSRASKNILTNLPWPVTG